MDKTIKAVLSGILICLIIIALKPVPSFQYSSPQSLEVSTGETIIQLGENRIGIVDTRTNSGMRGEIFVLEFNDETKSFDLIGRYNYSDFFSNPQKYRP